MAYTLHPKRPKPTGSFRPLRMDEARDFDLILPQTRSTYRYLAEQAAKQGVAIQGSDEANVQAAAGVAHGGDVAVMPRDEREAKYGKPLVYLSAPANQIPVLILNGGAYPIEALKEMADEQRHYGGNRLDRPAPKPDIQKDWGNYVERNLHRQRGRKQFGFLNAKTWI